MNINSINSYSQYSYGKVSTGVSNQNTSDDSTIEDSKKGPGGPRGPGGPGGKGGGPKGPDLDLDSDGSWSKAEVEEYSAYSESELNISLDVEDIFSKYDADSDGNISSSERKSLAKDNALKLSSPKDIMKSMMSENRMSIPLASDEENEDSTSFSKSILNESFIAKYLQAYQSTNNYSSQQASSLFDEVL